MMIKKMSQQVLPVVVYLDPNTQRTVSTKKDAVAVAPETAKC